jgi:anti-anti-sigma factor
MPVPTQETLVLEAPARLTIGRGDAELRATIRSALDQGYRSIVLDMENVRRLDSSGVGEIIAAHVLVRDLGGRLVLGRLSTRAGGVLAATRLTGVLEIHDSLEGALLGAAA